MKNKHSLPGFTSGLPVSGNSGNYKSKNVNKQKIKLGCIQPQSYGCIAMGFGIGLVWGPVAGLGVELVCEAAERAGGHTNISTAFDSCMKECVREVGRYGAGLNNSFWCSFYCATRDYSGSHHFHNQTLLSRKL